MNIDLGALQTGFGAIAERFRMTWLMSDQETKRRVMILAWKSDHCLVDLLCRRHTGDVEMIPTAIAFNHPRETYNGIDFGDMPFHHLPITKETKREQEAAIWGLLNETKSELVVLARYITILSDDISAKLLGTCINIHRSLLSGFKGARPYQQAMRAA